MSQSVLLTSGRSWAIYNLLGPSKDEWGVKYDVQVNDAGGDTATVVLTVADEGRLKPFYSVELIALSRDTDSQGGHGYDVKAPIVLKPTQDGRRVGQVTDTEGFARPRTDSDLDRQVRRPATTVVGQL